MNNTLIKDSAVKQEFLSLVSSLLETRFNFANGTDENIIAPLRFALLQPNSYLRFVEDKVSDIRTVYKIYILTDSEDKLSNFELDDFEGSDVSLRLVVDNDSVKLDYNFFVKRDLSCQSQKEHSEYRVDQFKKQIVASSKNYDARYGKNNGHYYGKVNYQTALKEYTLEDTIKSSKVMKYEKSYESREGSSVKSEALMDSMPTASNGSYTITTRLTTNQAVVYTEKANSKTFVLADIDEATPKEFKFIDGKSRTLDEDDARYVLKRYSVN